MGMSLGNMFSYASMMFTKDHGSSLENLGWFNPPQSIG
jgi:hypothetical protein